MKKLFSFLILTVVIGYISVSNALDFSILDSYIDSSNTLQVAKKVNNIINNNRVILGDDLITTSEYNNIIKGKKIGVVANQTSINASGKHIKDVLYNYKDTKLTALYAPEHGIDGKIKAGDYVDSHVDKSTNLPVYSLYGDTREPTKAMLDNIDIMLFDLQDIGSRTYTYISTMYKSMEACKKYGKTFVVLDRPNPLSCKFVEGFLTEDVAKSFVGIDIMPMAHGMTAGELAMYFNRNIGVDLKVIPMKNYRRDMIWQDTGLNFKQTSPYVPNIESAFLYMATGQPENMGIGMGDSFKWIGGTGIDSKTYADRLNSYELDGVKFVPQTKGGSGGVKVEITNYHTINPAKVGYYAMAVANEQKKLSTVLYEKDGKPSMFYKISGNKEFANAIRSAKSAPEIEELYRKDAEKFRQDTKKYYLYE